MIAHSTQRSIIIQVPPGESPQHTGAGFPSLSPQSGPALGTGHWRHTAHWGRQAARGLCWAALDYDRHTPRKTGPIRDRARCYPKWKKGVGRCPIHFILLYLSSYERLYCYKICFSFFASINKSKLGKAALDKNNMPRLWQVDRQ